MSQQIRTYFIGNSVTDTINQTGLDAIAESQGNDLEWGRHMIPGSALSWIWEHPNNGFQKEPYGYYPNALANYQWDALSLQPFDRPIQWNYEGEEQGDLKVASDFINLAKQKSPDLQVYIYQRWPRKNTANPTAEDWNNQWLATYDNDSSFSNNESRSYFDRLTTKIRDAFPDLKAPKIVPVGEVFYELNNEMTSGQIPGYSSIWDLYVDHIHLNNVGSYIVGSTYYATLYQSNPASLPVPAAFGTIDPQLAQTLGQTVWDVVSRTYSLGTSVQVDNTSPTAPNPPALAATPLAGVSDTLATTVSQRLPDGMKTMVLEGNGNLNAKGNRSDNLIWGNRGNNRLAGEFGNDDLHGKAGRDLLNGGAGDDILTGGIGRDRFSFSGSEAFSTLAMGLDQIVDFTPKQDKIQLDKTVFTKLKSRLGQGISRKEFAIVKSDLQAETSSAFIVYNQKNGKLFYNPNGDAAGFGTGGQFATLTGLPSIALRGFVIQA